MLGAYNKIKIIFSVIDLRKECHKVVNESFGKCDFVN